MLLAWYTFKKQSTKTQCTWNLSVWGWRQEDQGLKVSLDHRENLRPAWARRLPQNKNKNTTTAKPNQIINKKFSKMTGTLD